jgi:hypothetical protein
MVPVYPSAHPYTIHDYPALAASANYLNVMGYPEHNTGYPSASAPYPGPTAGFPWLQGLLSGDLSTGVNPHQLILGLAPYGHGWTYTSSGYICGQAGYPSCQGYLSNFEAQNLIQVPSERTNVFFMGHYDLTDNVTAYMDFFGNKTTAHSAVAPFLADTGIPSPLVISAQSIYNPFGVEFSNASGNRFEYRFTGVGQRISQFGTETSQIITGLKGNVGETSWQWDADLNYSRVSTGENEEGFLNLAAANVAFGPSFYNNGVPTCGTPGNAIVGCTPINIFDANNPSQTALLQQYVSHPFTQTIFITREASINANGDLFSLPAGTVRLAVGADYRKRYTSGVVSSDIQINPATGTCALGSVCTSSIQGGFNVKEAYAEVLVPLLKDAPFAHSLNVDIASRYSRYSLAGSTTW